MADPRDTTLTSEEQQLAVELMAAIDVRTLGGTGSGGNSVDRTQAPQRDDIVDPSALMSTVHSGSYVPGEEIGGAPAPADFTGLEYDLVGANNAADNTTEQPETVFPDRTSEDGSIEDPRDDGRRVPGADRPGSDDDRADGVRPDHVTDEESDEAGSSNFEESGRTGDDETFVVNAVTETAGPVNSDADSTASTIPTLDVDPVADAPTVTTNDVSGNEERRSHSIFPRR